MYAFLIVLPLMTISIEEYYSPTHVIDTFLFLNIEMVNIISVCHLLNFTESASSRAYENTDTNGKWTNKIKVNRLSSMRTVTTSFRFKHNKLVRLQSANV